MKVTRVKSESCRLRPFDFKTLLKYKWKTYNEKRNEKEKPLFLNAHI